MPDSELSCEESCLESAVTQPGTGDECQSKCPLRHESPSYVYARLHFWFEQRPSRDRRRAANRLKRAVREAELLEERLIDYWLELGHTALQGPAFPLRKPLRAKAS